jgi:hypothetical protein
LSGDKGNGCSKCIETIRKRYINNSRRIPEGVEGIEGGTEVGGCLSLDRGKARYLIDLESIYEFGCRGWITGIFIFIAVVK